MRSRLLRFPPELLAVPLARQRLLGPTLVTRLQVERVLLDVLDDVFLLNLALEAAECAFDRLAFLNLDFSHALNTPSLARWLTRKSNPVMTYGRYPVSNTELLAASSVYLFDKVANMLGYHTGKRILGVTRR